MHGGPDHFDAEGDERVEVVVEGIAEGRHEDDGAGGAGLVVVVDDLREPLVEHLPVHVGGFRHVGHVEIAIVVVADVLGVEPRQLVHAALARLFERRVGILGAAHVPVGDEVLAVGVGLDVELDGVVEEAHGLRVGAADHLVDLLHELLRADGLGGVEAAVDPDDGLAVAGESRACCSVRPSARARRRAICLYLSRFLMFSGEETIAMYWRLPSAVGPMSTSFMRSDSFASFCHQAVSWA